jgi:O-antigen/teichoic acid export membrane protein
MLIGGTAQYLGYLLVREGRFATGANGRVAQAVTYSATASALAVTAPVPAGIIYADFAARTVNAAWAGSWMVRNRKKLIKLPGRADIVAAAHRFREYPLISTAGGLINALGGTLTPLMIYGTFSAATAGQYGLVDRSVALPVALIITATSQVFSAQLASQVRAGGVGARARFRALVRWLSLICVGPAIVGVLLAPTLFGFVFGPGWERAGHFAQFMIPAYALVFVAGGVNMALIIIGDQRTQICWEIGRLAAMIALWLSLPKLGWSIESIVAAHAAVLGISALAFLVIADQRLRLFEHRGRANRDRDELEAIWPVD